MNATAVPEPSKPHDSSQPSAPVKLTERLLSLDAYRGIIMAALISNGLVLGVFKDDPAWGWLARQVDHVKWEGCVFWDIIQPAFMFMVGVAMPFAFAKRRASGQSFRQQLGHAAKRALGLLLLGMALTSITSGKATLEFIRVLQQIAIGYFLAFFLLDRKVWVQGAAAAIILVGYTLAWMFYPGNGPDGPWAMVNANLGSDFDRWLTGRNYNGFYVALNAIPATATILFGVMCGRLVGSGLPQRRVMLGLALAAAGGILAGLAFAPAVPMIKRIWTASFALFAGGWTVLFLLLFYWLIEVKGWRRWSTALVVVGMNSIFAYSLSQLLRPWFDKSILVFSKPLLTALFDWPNAARAVANAASAPWPAAVGNGGVVLQAALVLAAQWCVLYWLYRRKIFFKL